MSAPSEQAVEGQEAAARTRSIQACNFRSAGRLSNQNARALTAMHETFARNLMDALSAYVRTDVKVKVLELDQFSVKEHIAGVPPSSYIESFPLNAISAAMALECELELVFPLIDLLLGGGGFSDGEARALSEIEEEIMQDLALAIVRQAASAWGLAETPLAAIRHMEAADLLEVLPANEKVVVAKFEIEVASIVGTFQLVFPASLVGVLVKQSKQGQTQKKGALRFFPTATLRERILDCDVVVAADLPSMRVSVRDLIALQPGYVLKLRAPVRTPGVLTVEGQQIFEAVPVRNGAQKAAQVGRRVQPTSWGKE
jgi:flagellar motor switch protein FliM